MKRISVLLLLLPALLAAPTSAQFVTTVIQNCSFENGLAGWTVASGLATVTNTPDSLLPSDGSYFLILDPAATGNATPGHGPHPPGGALPGVAQVYQDFIMPSGDRSLTLAWEFVNVESIGSYFNDFVSIDLLDASGSLVSNIVFCDTAASGGAAGCTNVPGAGAGQVGWVPNQSGLSGTSIFDWNPAPAGYKVAFLDLVGITTPGQLYRIAISIGNVNDTAGDSLLLVDEVCVNAAQRNWNPADLRVLGSSHVDGIGTAGDQGGDRCPDTPFRIYTAPGQRLSFRARSSTEGTPWALVSGTLRNVGVSLPGLGTVNLDLFLPLRFELNGFAPRSPFEAYLGTISFNTNFIEAHVGTGAANVSRGYQAVMGNPVSAIGLSLSAATEITVGGPRIPVATSLVLGSAQSDDGFSAVSLSPMGTFTFYGTSYTEVYVNSNGSLTFGAGDSDLSESEYEMINDLHARIAVVWDDLNPSNTSASGNGDLFHDQTLTTYTCSWVDVTEYSHVGARNNFTVQLYDNGACTIYFGSTSMDDGLTGIAPGFGIATTWNSDLSTSSAFGGADVNISSTGAFFQRFGSQTAPGTSYPSFFADTCDVFTLGNHGRPCITFYPDGSGGYRVFTGTR